MDMELIGKIALAIIGIFAVTSFGIFIKINLSKKTKKKVIKTKQKINGDGNNQAGRDINIK